MSTYHVDRKGKRYDNAVDIVVRLHDQPNLAPKVWHLRDLHMFGSVTSHELPIQLSVEGEFRQHDGVVTMMMFYRRRASPKHRYNMIEVDYGGGGHRTRLRDQEINCCVYGVPPAPIYKGARGEAAGQGGGCAKGGVLLPPGV